MNVYQVANNFKWDLNQLENHAIKEIAYAYKEAEAEIITRIKFFENKIKQAQIQGLEPSLSWYYQEARLNNILNEISIALETFQNDYSAILGRNVAPALMMGGLHTYKLGEVSVIGDFGSFPKNALVAAQGMLYAADSPLVELINSIAPNAINKIKAKFTQAIIEGWNPRKFGRELKSTLVNTTRDRAFLIARTELIRAYRMGNSTVMQANGKVLAGWRWTAAKTPATCAMCLAFDGREYPLSEILMSHPACRCVMVPIPKVDFFPDNQPQTGKEYFDDLTPAQQDKILGKTKGEMYRKGEFDLQQNVKTQLAQSPSSQKWGGAVEKRIATLKELKKTIQTSGFQPHDEWIRSQKKSRKSLQEFLDETQAMKTPAPAPSIPAPAPIIPPAPVPAPPLSKIDQALIDWENAPSNSKGKRSLLPYEDSPEYKKLIDFNLFDSVNSSLELIEYSNLKISNQYPKDALVKFYINNDGQPKPGHIPKMIRHKGKLYIHEAEDVALAEARRLLGYKGDLFKVVESKDILKPIPIPPPSNVVSPPAPAPPISAPIPPSPASFPTPPISAPSPTNPSVNLNPLVDVDKDVGPLVKSNSRWKNVNEIKAALKNRNIDVRGGFSSEEAEFQALNFLYEMVDKNIHDANYGLVIELQRGDGATVFNPSMITMRENWISRFRPFDKDSAAVSAGILNPHAPSHPLYAYDNLKVQTFTQARTIGDLYEAVISTRKILKSALASKDFHLLKDFALNNYDVFSVRAIKDEWQLAEEFYMIWNRGEYRFGMLPDVLEKKLIQQFESYYGKRNILPKYSQAENIMWQKIGAQKGSNPGGFYLGRDGKRRYVKNIASEERLYNEQAANIFYESLGVKVPKTEIIIDGNGQKSFASQILDGQLLKDVQKDKLDSYQDLMDGYFADAFIANWDVLGMTEDNILMVGKSAYRIDNGAGFLYRAQGTAKGKAVTNTIGEFQSLIEPGKGQYSPIVKALGINDTSSDEWKDFYFDGVDNLILKLNSVVDGSLPEAQIKKQWEAWISSHPQLQGMPAKYKKDLVEMISTRHKLVYDHHQILLKTQNPNSAKFKLDKILKSPEGNLQLTARSYGEYNQWLADNVSSWWGNVTKSEFTQIQAYKGNSYDTIFNTPQRHKRRYGYDIPDANQKRIDKIRSAMLKNDTGMPEDVVLLRKLDGTKTESKWNTFTSKDVGTVISDDGFMSTALSPDVWSGNTWLRITMRKGDKRWIPPADNTANSANPGEMELILQPGIELLIKKVYKGPGGETVIECEALPPGFKLPAGTVVRYARDIKKRFLAFNREIIPTSTPTMGPSVHNSGFIDNQFVFNYSLCSGCKFKHPDADTCDAFLGGIPVPILLGYIDHRKATPGDLGIQFEAEFKDDKRSWNVR